MEKSLAILTVFTVYLPGKMGMFHGYILVKEMWRFEIGRFNSSSTWYWIRVFQEIVLAKESEVFPVLMGGVQCFSLKGNKRSSSSTQKNPDTHEFLV